VKVSNPPLRAAPAIVGVVLAAAGLLLVPRSACAQEITAKDIQVIGRTLGFMEDAGSGTVELGIVYARNEPESVRQAKAMQAMLGAGMMAGKVVLRPHLVATDELAKLEQIGALFVVPGGPSIAAAAALAAQRLHVPTLSTDVACAEAGQCVLGFRSDPTVEIVFSRGAAAGAGVRFTPAFRMLVKQV
jgi:hypothetical protein